MDPELPEDCVFSPEDSGEGRAFVYVLPYAGEDWVKLGFSSAPLIRFQAFHRRWFEVFDLDRGFLVEAETVREARQIELRWRHKLSIHRAPAPLVVDRRAGGDTEWLRGAMAQLGLQALELQLIGYRLHQPFAPWIRHTMATRLESVRAWVLYWNEQNRALAPSDPMIRVLRRMVSDTTDAYIALDVLCAQTNEQIPKEWI